MKKFYLAAGILFAALTASAPAKADNTSFLHFHNGHPYNEAAYREVHKHKTHHGHKKHKKHYDEAYYYPAPNKHHENCGHEAYEYSKIYYTPYGKKIVTYKAPYPNGHSYYGYNPRPVKHHGTHYGYGGSTFVLKVDLDD